MPNYPGTRDCGKGINGVSYVYADSGCDYVSQIKGYQVHCLDCPLKKCIHDVELKQLELKLDNKREVK